MGMPDPRVSRKGASFRDAAQKEFASARVALVPQTQNRNINQYKSVVSDMTGRFTLTGVAPGEYRLLAWENVPNNAGLNAEFLASYENRSQRITVNPGPSTRVALAVIR